VNAQTETELFNAELKLNILNLKRCWTDPQILLASATQLILSLNGSVNNSITVAKGVDELIDLAEVAPKLKTQPNTAFFWSGKTNGIGGADRALEIDKTKDATTLKGLIESKGIKMPEWDVNNPDSVKAWEDVSASYADQVSGEVKAAVGKNLRPDNIWKNVELDRLKANKNVTKITTIDPETLEEIVIFTR
jgi:hypothetical protein